jgi:hypothetical protein
MHHTPGAGLIREADRKNFPSIYLPKVEKPEHQEMYAFYENLGDKRTLAKVGEKFNKSRAGIALIARAFHWAERIDHLKTLKYQDPLLIQNKTKLDRSRKQMILVVDEVTETLGEMAYISKDIRHGHMTPEKEARLAELQRALDIWGFEWKSPKDLRTLMQTLKEIKIFNEESGKTAPTNATQINAEKFELHIKDD